LQRDQRDFLFGFFAVKASVHRFPILCKVLSLSLPWLALDC
jgi:hypothetical protein